jgi:hypothetical protein
MGTLRAAGIAIVVSGACGSSGTDKPKPSCIDAGDHPIGHVGACDLSIKSWRYVYNSVGPVGHDVRVREAVARLVERELLAQGALDAGEPAPSAKDVEKRLVDGDHFANMGHVPWIDERGSFDFHGFDDYVHMLGVTRNDFVAELGREQLAEAMVHRIAPKPADELDKVEAWVHKRCAEVKAAGAIAIDANLAPGVESCP